MKKEGEVDMKRRGRVREGKEKREGREGEDERKGRRKG